MSHGINLNLEQLISLRAKARGLLPGFHGKARLQGPAGYLSPFRGRGMEFDEVRIYQHGDDARSIDWRVTARRGETYTKLFREERERPVYVLTDLHPCMFFGTRNVFKSVLAMQLAAIVAWAAEGSGDRVGGIIGGSKGHRELPPTPRRTGVLSLLHGLEDLQPDHPGELQPGRLDELLDKLVHIVRPGSLVLVISDFQEMGEGIEASLSAIRWHSDLRIGFISDPLETGAPPKGHFRLGTPALQLNLDTTRSDIQTQWPALFTQRFDKISAICQKERLPLAHFSTADDPVAMLRGWI